MKDIPFAKDLYLYTGSTFDGSIIIKDVHGEPYMIDQDDEIRLYFKPVDNDSGKETVQITLTSNDEIMGEYPFKLTAEITESIEGDYEYYAFVHFADGDRYQIVPRTPLHARVPRIAVCYSENKNTIFAQVPRVMGRCGCHHAENE